MGTTRTPIGTIILLAGSALALMGCERGGPASPRAAEAQSPAADATDPRAAASAGVESAAAQITADYLREQVTTLSSDAFEGRGTASRGDAKAADYLVNRLKAMHYSPGGGVNGGGADGWRQTFGLIGVTAQMPRQWTFEHDGRSLPLEWWNQYIAASGMQAERVSFDDAEVVFVGYGIQAPEFDWDDFKGADLQGKVLLMLNNDPDWDPNLFEGKTRLYYGRWDYKYESAARQGAVGALIIHTTSSAGYPFQVVQTSWSGEQFELPAGGEPRTLVNGWLTEDAARKLVAMAGMNLDRLVESAKSRDFKPVPLGVTTSLSFTNTVHRATTMNVCGLLRGRDRELNDEVVIYTAHHDHLGIGQPDEDGDRIYNGALDNGAGMAQVLAIARAFASLPQPPRRSVLILFVGAEEQGLLGSQYYSEHPTFAPGRIAAEINYDGGDIWGRTRDVTFIGKGKSTLDPIVDRVAASQGRVVEPDQFPDRGYFYRSDQFNFARIGVPALFLDTGTDFIGRPAGWGRQQVEDFEAHRYHQPSDEIDSTWNFDGMIEDARLGFRVGLRVANADEMPGWTPGDEFEAARKAALEAVRSE